MGKRNIYKTFDDIKKKKVVCNNCRLVFSENDIKQYKIFSIFKDKKRIMLCEPCFLDYIKGNVKIDEILSQIDEILSQH
jgi:hypothetical protein